MKTSKKQKDKGPSNLIDRMMRRMPSHPLRDATYVRGAMALFNKELKAIGLQPFMRSGAIIITVKPADVNKLDTNNTIGAAVRDFIFYGRRLEQFHIGPKGTPVRVECDATTPMEVILHKAANIGKSFTMGDMTVPSPTEQLFPIETEMLQCIYCIAIPGQVLAEVQNGFAPYILIGIRRDDEEDIRWTRVSLQDARPAATKWLKQLLPVMAQHVF